MALTGLSAAAVAFARAAGFAVVVVCALAGARRSTRISDASHLRRLHARHQPGQLPVAGHGGQAQGRHDEGTGARSSSARRSSSAVFRDNRWDYVYEFTRQGVVREHRTFTVYFVDDKLARWEGDEMPISVAELNKSAAAITAGEGAWSDPRSWWEQLLDIFKK
jgi:hypothetical protein